MKQEPIVNVPDRSPEAFDRIKRVRKKMALLVVPLIVLNTLLALFIINGPDNFMDHFWQIVNALVFGVTVLGFIIGLLITLVPYRGLPYTYKYVWASMISILSLHGFITVVLMALGASFS